MNDETEASVAALINALIMCRDKLIDYARYDEYASYDDPHHVRASGTFATPQAFIREAVHAANSALTRWATQEKKQGPHRCCAQCRWWIERDDDDGVGRCEIFEVSHNFPNRTARVFVEPRKRFPWRTPEVYTSSDFGCVRFEKKHIWTTD